MRGTHVLAGLSVVGVFALLVYGVATSKKASPVGTPRSAGDGNPPDSSSLQGTGSIASAHPADEHYVNYDEGPDPSISPTAGGGYRANPTGAAILGDPNADLPGE